MMRELIGNPKKNKLIAFDVNVVIFQILNMKMKKQRAHWIKTAGGSSIYTNQLINFKKKKLKIFNLSKEMF